MSILSKALEDVGVQVVEKALREYPCESVDEVRSLMQYDEDGNTIQSIANSRIALDLDPVLHGKLRYNELTGLISLDGIATLPWQPRSTALTDYDLNNILAYLECTYGIKKERNIRIAIDLVAGDNSYHPIRDYLTNLRWDGESRIYNLMPRYLGTVDSPYTREIIRLLMMAAIHRVFEPGCKFEIMVCLVGAQGAGKSSFLRYLACNDEWYTDDLKRLDDERVYQRLMGHWFVEMAEMTPTTSARTIEIIKAFLSRQKDSYRIPYERYAQDRPRQCVFVGTSNNLDLLPLDRTGNRRFAPIMIHPETAQIHILEDPYAREYINQCWAEAYTLYLRGNYSLKLSSDAERHLQEIREAFSPEDTIAGVIQAFLGEYSGDFVCTALLYQEALGHSDMVPGTRDCREIGQVMDELMPDWIRVSSHRFPKYGTQRAWRRANVDK